MEVLESKFQWREYGEKHYELRYTKFIQSYYLFEKFNIDYRLATYSSQICAGELSRDDALKKLERKPYDDAEIEIEVQYVSKKLGISTQEFGEIMAAPPKSYRDYPNNQWMLELLYAIYRKLNLRKY